MDLQVWVLGASTGGIKVVPDFLSRVPCRKDVVFIYVQHLVPQQHRQLLRAVERHSDWPVCGVNYGSSLKGGQVVIPSAEERFDIDRDGLIGVIDGGGWKPPYSPNIDDVASQVSGFYGRNSGIIIFTGMGDDGCRGSTVTAQNGGQVWIQSPETCQAVSMPKAVSKRLNVDYTASIEGLAEKFNKKFGLANIKMASGDK